MSLIIFALLQALPVPPAVTPASRTEPLVNANCKITDPQNRQYDLAIRQSGGRGYLATQKDGSTSFPRTWLKHDIIRDTAHIFDGLDFELDSGRTWPGREKAWKRGGPFLQLETNETTNHERFSILIRKPDPFVSYVGFCDVKKSPQQPLSAEEIGRIRQP